MNYQPLISGLDQEWLRDALGEAVWVEAASRWREADALLASDGTQIRGDETLVWLYRSPAMAVLSAPAGGDAKELLESWARRARAALNLRRVLKSRVVFACVDDLVPEQLASLVAGAAISSPAHADARQTARIRLALDAVLATRLTWLGQVHSLIDAASVVGDAAAPGTTEEPVLVVLEEYRALFDRACSGDVRSTQQQAGLDALGSERANLLSTIVELQGALDECSSARSAALDRCRELERELQSLHTRMDVDRACLAFERAKCLNLTAEVAALQADCRRFLQQLVRTQEALERKMVDADQLPAMRLQLSYLQEELVSRSNAAVAYEPVPLLRRIKRRARHMLRRNNRSQADLDREAVIGTLRASPWFDQTWYLSQYQDVAQAGVDPVVHYVDHGAAEERDPGPRFSTRFYIDANQDVVDAGMNPLLHFIRHGLGEGRLPRRPS